MWDYKVVPVQTGAMVQMKPEARAGLSAAQFGELIRGHAVDGWEFYRTDAITYYEHPGCILGLLGASTVSKVFTMAVFRRAR